MLHEWIRVWFHWVDQWGYVGIFVLMAMESSIIPVPSEVVMAPAAFWAAQGRMSFAGVVLAGTAGSYVGSALCYWSARAVGMPVIQRFGKYFLISEKKVLQAESWIDSYGTPGVFLARLLPVIRHLISIPAGIFRMPFWRFTAATILGAGLWCLILSWFGSSVIGDSPQLLESPEQMIAVLKHKLQWFVLGVFALAVLYSAMVYFRTKAASRISARPT